jgi:uncharacterized protein
MAARRNFDERDEADELEFEWYPPKAAANLRKHKASFAEGRTIFGDRKHLVVPDNEHSFDEPRSLVIGRSSKGRLLTMCFTERGDRIRIISVRAAETWERRQYETANG